MRDLSVLGAWCGRCGLVVSMGTTHMPIGTCELGLVVVWMFARATATCEGMEQLR